MHHQRESIRATESIAMHDLTAVAIWVSGNARLPTSAAHEVRNVIGSSRARRTLEWLRNFNRTAPGE
jgi:hypothetical protein